MEKQKKFGTLASFLARILTPSARLSLVQLRYGNPLNSVITRFPVDSAGVKRILVILPEDELEARCDTSTVLSLRQYFGATSLSLLCSERVADFFRIIPNVTEIIQHEPAGNFLFSAPFTALVKTLRAAEFDLVFLLDRAPGPATLALVAATRATYRIGFAGAAEFPFLNYRIRPSTQWTYLSDRNSALSRVIGAPPAKPVRWTVPKESLEEVRHMLREQNINPEKKLLGLDAVHMFHRFGAAWLDALLDRLRAFASLSSYCVSDGDAEVLLWLKERGIAILPPLSVPKTAALIQLSVLQIAGNSTLYQLAYLLQRPTIGIFSEDQFAVYCRPTESCRGIAYKEAPDVGTISAILDLVARAGITAGTGT